MGSWSMIFSVFVQTAALPQTCTLFLTTLFASKNKSENEKRKDKKNVTTVGWFSETGK